MSRTNFVLRTPKSILSLGTTECKEMACLPRAKKTPKFPQSIILAIAQLGQWGPSRLGQPVGTPACPCGLPGSLPQHGKHHDFLVFAHGPSAPSSGLPAFRTCSCSAFSPFGCSLKFLRNILTLPRLLLPSRPCPIPPCPACHPRLAGICRPASPLLAVPRAALRGTLRRDLPPSQPRALGCPPECPSA